MNIDDLYTATGYGRFVFKRVNDLCNVDILSMGPRISCGSKEQLEATFQQELEQEVMDIAYARIRNSWCLVESYPIITISPASIEEKVKVIIAALKEQNEHKSE